MKNAIGKLFFFLFFLLTKINYKSTTRMDDEKGMKYLMTENNDKRQKFMWIMNVFFFFSY